LLVLIKIMKIRLFLTIFSAFIFIFIENSIGQYAGGLKYDITGNVNVKDGTRIALVLDSKGMTHRLITTIKNKRFEFSGENPETESARLFYEEDILNNKGMLAYFRFFLAKEVKIQSESDTIRNFKVINPDSVNKELQVYYINFRKICDSVYRSPRFKNLKQEEKSNLVGQRLLVLNLPVNSIVRLEQISSFHHNQDITDSMVLAFVKPMNNELKKSMYYKRLMRIIYGKKILSEGKPFMDFEVQDTLGEKHKLSTLLKNNNFIVIDFYTTWCGPCRTLAKDLTKYYDLCHDKGFDVICISCDDSKDDWKEYIKDSKPKWNSFWIDNSDTVCDLYKMNGYPTIYRLDGKGIITGKSYIGLHKAIEETFTLEPLKSKMRKD
jgi:peroxiredoxin